MDKANSVNGISYQLILYLQEYQKVVDAEWQILYDKLDKIHQSGATVVLSKLPIGDVATQYFADRYVKLSARICSRIQKKK